MRASEAWFRWMAGAALGGTRDEAILEEELRKAIERLHRAPAGQQPELRARIDGLYVDLARALERSGREHLASALLPCPGGAARRA